LFSTKESSYLITFNSPFGRYRFNFTDFGLSMSLVKTSFRLKLTKHLRGTKE